MDWVVHNWEGRQRKTLNTGYIAIYYPEHPFNNKNYVLEHRLLMENHLGRYLNPEEVVHHLNENKTCNKIWNLFLCSVSEHTIIHRMGKKHSGKIRAQMSRKHTKVAKSRKRNSSGQFQ